MGLAWINEVSDAKRLEALESENAKLKKLLAEAELYKAVMKDLRGDASIDSM